VHPPEVTLPGVASSVPPARHFVERTLSEWGLDDAGWTAALLVTELAANAALHAGTEFTVRVAVVGDRVRLEVQDGSLTVPRQRNHSAESTTGRGLRLVSELAADWGVHQTDEGKVVWVELSTAVSLPEGDEDETDLDALLDAFSDEVEQPDAAGSGRTALSLAA
jgi:anti-sigma regulatory factor (Ser/Thr protein kinase)